MRTGMCGKKCKAHSNLVKKDSAHKKIIFRPSTSAVVYKRATIYSILGFQMLLIPQNWRQCNRLSQ